MSQATTPSLATLLADAQCIVRTEAQGMLDLAERLNESIARAIVLIHEHTGPDLPGLLVISGVGKPGIVGQRLSASFASTGTPSIFLHPVEAIHGDVGRVRRNDVVLLLSYSGESDELPPLIDVLKRMNVPLISVTRSRNSTLGRASDLCIELGPIEEVCPLRLAPTTTVNCISVVGDAIVLGVMGLRKFSAADFAAFHPAGALGRRLLKVGQVMSFKIGENFVAIPESLTVREALSRDVTTNTTRRAGSLLLVNDTGRLSGIFSNGDMRRKIKTHPNLLDLKMSDVMTRNPKTVGPDSLASEALAMLNRYKILELPVIDADGRPVGMIDVQDLVSLRIVE